MCMLRMIWRVDGYNVVNRFLPEQETTHAVQNIQGGDTKRETFRNLSRNPAIGFILADTLLCDCPAG